MNMEAVMGVLLGIGLGAACGFRIFVPLLVAAIAIRGAHDSLVWLNWHIHQTAHHA